MPPNLERRVSDAIVRKERKMNQGVLVPINNVDKEDTGSEAALVVQDLRAKHL